MASIPSGPIGLKIGACSIILAVRGCIPNSRIEPGVKTKARVVCSNKCTSYLLVSKEEGDLINAGLS